MRRTASTGARGVARSWMVALLCLLAAGAAFHHFLAQRPGEAALRLIPRDALLAAALHTRPSPDQVTLFRRIHASMAREHASASLERAIVEATRDAPAAQEVRPYLDGSFAFALLKP